MAKFKGVQLAADHFCGVHSANLCLPPGQPSFLIPTKSQVIDTNNNSDLDQNGWQVKQDYLFFKRLLEFLIFCNTQLSFFKMYPLYITPVMVKFP